MSSSSIWAKLNEGLVNNNLQFADDFGLLTRNRLEPQDIMTKPVFGLMISAEKTKTMVTYKTKETPINISIQEEVIEKVEQFVYLWA